jgi:hypothetical protein
LNAKNSTQVMSANAISSVLWPHRATIPTMFHSPEIALLSTAPQRRRLTSLNGGRTVHFQALSNLVAGLKNGLFGATFPKNSLFRRRRLHRFSAN